MKNWYYFIFGLIGVFSAITHTMDGLTTELPALSSSNIEYIRQAIFAFNYHIVAADHLGVGIALIVMAFQKNMAIIKSAAWVIMAILFARAVVSLITVFSVLNDSGNAGTFWIPAVFNTIGVLLLWLGTRVSPRAAAASPP